MSNLVYGLNKQVTGTGGLGIGNVKDEAKVRFVVSNAGPANVFRVRARIKGQVSWTNLIDCTGNVNQVLDVFTWDQIEVICLVYDSQSNFVNIVAQSFDNAAGPTFILPGDVEVEGSILTLTSQDNSVIITGNPTTGTIDLSVVGGGSSKYLAEFEIADFTGPSAGEYTLVIPFTAHQRINPKIQLFEDTGSEFENVLIKIAVDNSGDITIKVSEVPDLRFSGKAIII